MTPPESALDIAREVAPGLEWVNTGFDHNTWAFVYPGPPRVMITFCNENAMSLLPTSWEASAAVRGEVLWCKSDPDPRVCLRAVIAEVHRWALDVARATVPAGYQLVTACVRPEIPGEDPDPIY